MSTGGRVAFAGNATQAATLDGQLRAFARSLRLIQCGITAGRDQRKHGRDQGLRRSRGVTRRACARRSTLSIDTLRSPFSIETMYVRCKLARSPTSPCVRSSSSRSRRTFAAMRRRDGSNCFGIRANFNHRASHRGDFPMADGFAPHPIEVTVAGLPCPSPERPSYRSHENLNRMTPNSSRNHPTPRVHL